jgi:hypothetical protein
MMVTERFAVIRGDNHVGILKQALTLQGIEQATELFVEKRNAIVVAVTNYLYISN